MFMAGPVKTLIENWPMVGGMSRKFAGEAWGYLVNGLICYLVNLLNDSSTATCVGCEGLGGVGRAGKMFAKLEV